jgi:hypothetical protein
MKIRQAKKILLRSQVKARFFPKPPPRLRRAIQRYLRWPHRQLADHNCSGALGHYTLDELGRPRLFTGDLLDWALLHSIQHFVRFTETPQGHLVSTIFLGLDHNFAPSVPRGQHTPILYETMVALRGEGYDEQHRYPTRHDALVDHELIVSRIEKVP